MKDKIIEIILRLPGLGTADHCILSGIDMEDIQETAAEIFRLIENENAKLKNDLDILNESLKHHKAISEKLRDIYLKKCKELQPSNECPYCAPDGTIWNGDGSKICHHCKGSHYIDFRRNG